MLNIKMVTEHPEPCRCGMHIPLNRTLYETISSDTWSCCQIFLGNPCSFECRTLEASDIEKTRDWCHKHRKSFYVHCPYVANLAKSDNEKSYQIVAKELKQIEKLPAACVLHVGKVGTAENVAEGINRLDRNGFLTHSADEKVQFKLLLENAAGQGTEIGRSWEELRKVYEALDKTKIGLCFDTQHGFAAGMNKLENHEDVVKLFDASEELYSKGISLIHLNDSQKVFGSNVDRHAALGQGHIWYQNRESLKSLREFCRDKKIDLVSETDQPLNDLYFLAAAK